jgi:pimeloyl-ACP methyl ester carboxylesterase
MTEMLQTTEGTLAYDDTGGEGPLVVLMPGAGDVRSEHRFLAAHLAADGYRVVTVELRGHGEASPAWPSYGLEETAQDILALVDHLDAGPAVVVANSFAPAAAMWAATEAPGALQGIVAISPHLTAGGSALQRGAMQVLLRGPWAGAIWTKLYRGWYKTDPPADLDEQVAMLGAMMRDPDRRRAVRETLVADRDGLSERLTHLDLPVLAVFGTADDHFPDPESEAKHVVAAAGGRYVMVEGAGHYPHVEQPEVVGTAVAEFLRDVA